MIWNQKDQDYFYLSLKFFQFFNLDVILSLFLLAFRLFSWLNVPMQGGRLVNLLSDTSSVRRFLLNRWMPSGSCMKLTIKQFPQYWNIFVKLLIYMGLEINEHGKLVRWYWNLQILSQFTYSFAAFSAISTPALKPLRFPHFRISPSPNICLIIVLTSASSSLAKLQTPVFSACSKWGFILFPIFILFFTNIYNIIYIFFTCLFILFWFIFNLIFY